MKQQRRQENRGRVLESIILFIGGMLILWVVNQPVFIIVTAIVVAFVLVGITLAVVAFFKNDRFNAYIVGKLPK